MLNALKNLFYNSKNIEKDSYLWNTIQSTLISTQSVLLLMVINRTLDLAGAGVFSIAYAIASLIYYVGEFGVRKYQITDVTERCSFADYYTHRLITCAVAVLASVIYAAKGWITGQYTAEKFLVIIIVCGIKVLEAYCDVFFARFQQMKRLDVAAKASTYRIVLPMICCGVALVMTHDLLISSLIWLATTVIAVLTSFVLVAPDFGGIRIRFKRHMLYKITRDCLPLFAGNFLLLYVGNAPKYAIDACLNDEAQACYNFIFMPVFAVGMLANFIFNPILVTLAEKWNTGDIKGFKRILFRQIGVIAGITLLAVAVALTIGCPVLGLMFNADLAGNEMSLTLLMIGGGMLALANLFVVVVIVVRGQKYLMIGYIVAAAGALTLSKYFVRNYGIPGAAVLYVSLMTLISLIFAVVLAVCMKRNREIIIDKKTEEQEESLNNA